MTTHLTTDQSATLSALSNLSVSAMLISQYLPHDPLLDPHVSGTLYGETFSEGPVRAAVAALYSPTQAQLNQSTDPTLKPLLQSLINTLYPTGTVVPTDLGGFNTSTGWVDYISPAPWNTGSFAAVPPNTLTHTTASNFSQAWNQQNMAQTSYSYLSSLLGNTLSSPTGLSATDYFNMAMVMSSWMLAGTPSSLQQEAESFFSNAVNSHSTLAYLQNWLIVSFVQSSPSASYWMHVDEGTAEQHGNASISTYLQPGLSFLPPAPSNMTAYATFATQLATLNSKPLTTVGGVAVTDVQNAYINTLRIFSR